MAHTMIRTSYVERLSSFETYWEGHEATARQLASIGHVSDRPPLESLEEGSRCISCSLFMPKAVSIRALEGDIRSIAVYLAANHGFTFHHPGCLRLQVRIPLDPAWLQGMDSSSVSNVKRKFEKPQLPATCNGSAGLQSSSFFSLPTELRLQIYAMVLPSLGAVSEIVPLNRDSARVITRAAITKVGRRDMSRTNLLQTCRTVHDEALDLLYHSTRYKFGSTKVLYLFLRNIGQHGRRLLKSIDVHCGLREDAIAFALLACCENLRSIVVRLSRPRIAFPRAPIWCNVGAMCLLGLSGLEEVNFEPTDAPTYMRETNPDATIIRRELMRPRNTAGRVKIVDGDLVV